MDFNSLLKKTEVDESVAHLLADPHQHIPDIETTISISETYGVSLHPFYTYYWLELSVNEFINLLSYLRRLKIKWESSEMKYGYLPSSEEKRHLELIGVEHKVKQLPLEKITSEKETELLIFSKQTLKTLLTNLQFLEWSGFDETWDEHIDRMLKDAKDQLSATPLDVLNTRGPLSIRDKGGTYIGARMGRPEKAKMRKLDGRPHGLFPVGDEGGRMRNIMEAYDRFGKVTAQFALYYDEQRNEETIYRTSEEDGSENKFLYFDRFSGQETKSKAENAVRYKTTTLDITKYVNQARSVIGSIELPKMVKGIRGTSNRDHISEHLVKAFLRAKHDVYVNKDGTVRYDMIEMGITHFRPLEIGTDIEKLKEMGYTYDYYGKPLEREDQIVEMYPQDIILPDCDESGDELASDFILKTAAFTDELLEKLYGLPRFYNFTCKEDTIGHLVIGLAPHTSAGIVGRILGYSKTQGCFAHPVWHAAQRRNLDGDENGIMLLMDGLINFSRNYLPDRRGSRTMDTSLVLTSHIYLDQIDDEVHGMDIVPYYPLELYRSAKEFASPKDVKLDNVGKRIEKEETDERYFGYHFTHDTSDMNNTVLCSSYKSVPNMKDKLELQLNLGRRLRAVNEHQVGSFIIDKHFMKDIKGNLKKFSMQSFRCTKCNTIFRRPPLVGKCTHCGEPSINFTISEGSIKKYLEPSFKIIREFEVDPYIVETLELVNLRIEGVFGKESEKQRSLQDFWK